MLPQNAETWLHLTPQDWSILAPTLTLSVGALLALAADLFAPTSMRAGATRLLSLLALGVAILLTVYQYIPATNKAAQIVTQMGPSLRDVWSFRMETVIGSLMIQVLTLLTLIGSGSWLTREDDPHHGEFHILCLMFAIGGILLVSAKHLMLAFVGLELLSISLYVLVAIRRNRYQSVEAGLKYFLLGAFAGAIFLYGTALLYAGNGSLSLLGIESVNRPGLPRPEGLAALGGALLFVALFFKASVVPFHMWTPDVYQGAPTPITALMSTGTKVAAFLLLLAAAPLIPRELLVALPTITILTIVVGNLGALVQGDLKRLIAYSGIAHAGYLMIAFSALCIGTGPQVAAHSVRAIVFYLAAYGVTNLAALFVVAQLERRDPSLGTLNGIKGLARRHPSSAVVLTIAMLSLAGIPPTIGFWGKYLVLAAALHTELYVLTTVGLLFSVIGLYYYLRVVVNAWFLPGEGDDTALEPTDLATKVTLALTTAAIVIVGIVPSLLLNTLVHVKL
jgi:NADH-quinone oxidoreductase subunit N